MSRMRIDQFSRRDCLKVIAAGVPLAVAQSALAQDETLTGYLMSTGRDSSFAARKVLWSDYRPAEKYTGSAQQNIDFLKAIKTFDAAPQIELVKVTCGQNEDVNVTVKATGIQSVGIETGLGLQSMSAQVGGVVSLGKASAAGTYCIRVSDGTLDRRYQLFLLPKNSGFDVELYGATAKSLPQSSPVFYQPEANIADALAKLYGSLTSDAIQDALEGAIPPWLAENAGALGETIVVCAVGGPVPCLVSGAANGWSAMSAILTKLASNSPALNGQEKQLLNTVFAVGDAAGQVAASFFGIPQRKRLCELSELGIVIADSVAGQIEAGQIRVTLKIVLQSTKKYTTLLCAAKL